MVTAGGIFGGYIFRIQLCRGQCTDRFLVGFCDGFDFIYDVLIVVSFQGVLCVCVCVCVVVVVVCVCVRSLVATLDNPGFILYFRMWELGQVYVSL